MNKSFNILRLSFHILNFITIVLYLYPGSILGWLIYDNIQYQPQLTKNYLNISSNHLYVFFLLSILGLFVQFFLKDIYGINMPIRLRKSGGRQFISS